MTKASSSNRSMPGVGPNTGGKPGDHDPVFGELLAQRRPSIIHWVVVLILAAFTAGGIILTVVGVRMWLFRPATRPLHAGMSPPASDDWVQVIIGLILTAVFGVITYYLVREAMTRTRFYELGVRNIAFGKVRRAMAYAECERFTFNTVRQYVNGIYAGTALTVTMKAKGKPTIKWSGSHKEKPKGFSITIFGKGEFKGEDELDVVKLVIADAMADRWIGEMSGGMTKVWCKQLGLGIDHAVILAGKRKTQEVPYENLDRIAFKKGWFHLFHKGDEKSCISAAIGAENFWPGLRVLERMWLIAAPGREISHAEDDSPPEST